MRHAVKLGGSVITGPDRAIDEEALSRVAGAIAGHDAPLVVVHGAGSFGHPLAHAAGIDEDTGTHDAPALHEIEQSVEELRQTIIDVFHDHDISAVPFDAHSAGVRDGAAQLDLEAITAAVGEGFVPVIGGDIIITRGAGATVVSGDEIVLQAAAALGTRVAGMAVDTGGVHGPDGAVMDEMTRQDGIADPSAGTDVTGGMAGKLDKIFAHGQPTRIFGADELGAFLSGGAPRTLVDPPGGTDA